MADEDNVVEEGKKSGGGLGGIIPLITLVLVVVSIGISTFAMIQTMGAVKAIQDAQTEAEKPELTPGEISVMEIDIFTFTDDFIFIYEDPENDLTHNVVVSIGVGLHNTKETAEEVATVTATLTSKETIIRDGLGTLMKTKSFDDFKTSESQEALKQDILTYLQERLVTTVIVDVYFNDILTTSR